jgi:hypothetical protein
MASRKGRQDADDQGTVPRNRARTVILLAVVLIVVVVFGYMLLVGLAN